MTPIKRIINKYVNKDFVTKIEQSISDLYIECINDSGVCGSFQSDGYCPIFGCLGCKLKEVKLIV